MESEGREPREASQLPIAVTGLSPAELRSLAALHRACLPATASAKAGLAAVAALYEALFSDPAAIVVWVPPTPALERGGFASGTTSLRDTEALIRRRVPPTTFVKLALSNLASPRHLLARRRWEPVIPAQRVGYVLTLGVRRDDRGDGPRGRLLLDELERRFHDRGAAEAWVDTEATNERALAFYGRAGYERVRTDAGQVLLRKVL